MSTKKDEKEDLSHLTPEEQLVYHIQNKSKISIFNSLLNEYEDIDLNHMIFHDEKNDHTNINIEKVNDDNNNNNNGEMIILPSDSLLTLAGRQESLEIIKWLLKNGCNRLSFIKNNETIFHIAAKSNNFEFIKILIDHEGTGKIDLNEMKNNSGLSPFSISLKKYHNAKVCKMFMKKGTMYDFSKKKKNGMMLIHEVCFEGNYKFFECLLELGESPFKKDENNNTILHHLLLNEKNDKKKQFIDSVIKRVGKLPQEFLDSENNKGETILQICLFNLENVELAKYLIKNGCLLKRLNLITGMTLLHKASFDGNEKVLTELLTSFKLKTTIKDKYGNYPIHWSFNEKVFKKLNEKKTEINAQNDQGYTPLHNFIVSNKVDLVDLSLAEKKTNFKQKTNVEQNIFHLCAKYGGVEMILKLVEKIPANVVKLLIEEEDKNGHTPLEISINEKHPDVGVKLIENGAIIARKDKNLLLNSVQYKLSEVVTAIIKSGQEIDNLINELDAKTNYYPLHIAVNNNDLKSVDSLLNSGKCLIDMLEKENNCTPLMIACRSGYSDIALRLLKSNASTNYSDNDGKIALHFAAKSKNVDVSKILIENKSEINKADNKGRTPLHEACEVNNVEVIKYLIENKCDMQFKDKNGMTPLHVSVWNGCEEACLSLISNNSELNCVDKFGRTPLFISSIRKHTNCGRVLVKAQNERKKKISN